MHATPGATALVLLLVVATTQALAQGLASPGPLATAHARLDNLAHCLSCHDAGRALSGRKCLTCHVSIAAELRADRGYHAAATKHGTDLACGSCHSEHNGRPYQLVSWRPFGGKEHFDHAQTGWALQGAHARQHCDACHTASLVTDAAVRADSSLSVRRTYLGLGATCLSCHLDEHRGRVSRRCEDCHTVDAWKPAPRFDHDRTRFALTGAHRAVSCDKCHTVRAAPATGPTGRVDSSFVDFHATRAGWDRGCIGCHPSPHRDTGRLGACERCHTTDGWFVLADSVRRFDHTAVGFPLRGAHATARCESCHLPTRRSPLPEHVALVRANFLRTFARKKMAFRRCDACHASVHEGQLTGGAAQADCDACHTESRFTPAAFTLAAHDSSGFSLTGAHQAVPCSKCHTMLANAVAGSGRIRFRFAALNCAACHEDPHGGQFAGRHVPGSGPLAASEAGVRATCTPCHTTASWTVTAFNHDSTSYPLRGAHRTVACAKCHLSPGRGQPARFKGVPTSCDAAQCHGDPHNGQFRGRHVPGSRVVQGAAGADCTPCHDLESWARITFDHDSTRYPLHGAHRTVACGKCHVAAAAGQPVRFTGLGLTCGAPGCHSDPHAGQFAHRVRGSACTSCHTETAWTALVFDHQRDSDFPLDGAHRPLQCSACHRPEGHPPVVRYLPVPHRCEDCHAVSRPGGAT
jgi:hypothetical protein